MAQTKNIISYESSKWIIKLWRQRWYLYAIFLYIKCYLNPIILLEFLLENRLSNNSEKKMRINWKDIKHHIELSKMYKFSSRYERQD